MKMSPTWSNTFYFCTFWHSQKTKSDFRGIIIIIIIIIINIL